jgi:xylulokinase
MPSFVIAHDLGTTGNKATLYDRDGKLVGSAFHPYETEYALPRWAEQDPAEWWQAVCLSTRQLLHQTKTPADQIACIVFSGQMMGCVAVDKRGLPLRKAIIWADQRALDQERWLAERLSQEQIYRITGHRLSASYSLAKILWLRDHQPDIYRAAHKFLHAKDAIVARMTGEFVTDPSDASGMNLFDLEQGAWSEPILEAAHLDPAQLPEVRVSTDVVGYVLPGVAEEVGVAPGTPVVIGGGDGACAAAGAGVIGEGAAYNYVGSSSWIALSTSHPIYDPDLRTFTFGHVVPGMFMPAGTMQAAGASYQWMKNQLCPQEVAASLDLHVNPYELMNLEAQESPPGARGLLFLPYLMGERSPRWNPKARGAFIGLTIRHTRADMIRAVLEGVTMNLRVILDAFRNQGSQIEAMRLIGGGARGRFWNQVMADIYGMPIHRLAILEEATSMGAAVTGGVGVGLYPGFSIIEQMNQVAEIIQPDPQAQAAYAELLPVFEEAYRSLLPVYEQIAQLKFQ